MSIIWKSNNAKRLENMMMIKDYLKQKKTENHLYKVIDIGGASNPWADEFVDVYVDIQEMSNKRVFVGDIQSEDVWQKIEKENFDFCICSHTLEDIRNPEFVMNKMTKLFKEGFISMPNKHTELSHVESLEYLGYGHHRSIFTIQENVLILISKLVILNKFNKKLLSIPCIRIAIKIYKKITNRFLLSHPVSSKVKWLNNAINKNDNELAFIWRNGFDFKYINNDFIPSIKEYVNLIEKDLKNGL